MPLSKSDDPLCRRMGELVRWASLGAAAAMGFGIVLGLVIGLPRGSIDVALGGAAVGLVGGPVFGVVIGLGTLCSRRREWTVRHSALAGSVVFGLVPLVIGLIRHGEIIGPLDRASEGAGGLLFLAGAGGSFGAMIGLANRSRTVRLEKLRRNGWSELEL